MTTHATYGGILAPGGPANAIGTLTIGGNLILNSYSGMKRGRI
jgi:hypothetical protein